MNVYAIAGTITNITGETNWFLPGLTSGVAFSGTMTLVPDPAHPHTITADLHLQAGAHLVNARSVSTNPLQDFANHTPTGPFSSLTVQHGGQVTNAFLEVVIKGASLGLAGFSVQGPGPDGSPKAAGASGSVTSIIVLR